MCARLRVRVYDIYTRIINILTFFQDPNKINNEIMFDRDSLRGTPKTSRVINALTHNYGCTAARRRGGNARRRLAPFP